MSERSHPMCWEGDHYNHVTCRKPSGRKCWDCDADAGTLWGPYWCPECDVKRIDGISASLEVISLAVTE